MMVDYWSLIRHPIPLRKLTALVTAEKKEKRERTSKKKKGEKIIISQVLMGKSKKKL